MLKTLERNRNDRHLESLEGDISSDKYNIEEDQDVHKEYDEVISEGEKADL